MRYLVLRYDSEPPFNLMGLSLNGRYTERISGIKEEGHLFKSLYVL